MIKVFKLASNATMRWRRNYGTNSPSVIGPEIPPAGLR
jgi:hypothetical protein